MKYIWKNCYIYLPLGFKQAFGKILLLYSKNLSGDMSKNVNIVHINHLCIKDNIYDS